MLGAGGTVFVSTALSRGRGEPFTQDRFGRNHFFLPAFLVADLVDAFLADAFGDLGDFAEVALAAPAPDFLLPNTFSQFCQNFGVVPVRTIGPPTVVSP
jgi:hypothetical protein